MKIKAKTIQKNKKKIKKKNKKKQKEIIPVQKYIKDSLKINPKKIKNTKPKSSKNSKKKKKSLLSRLKKKVSKSLGKTGAKITKKAKGAFSTFKKKVSKSLKQTGALAIKSKAIKTITKTGRNVINTFRNGTIDYSKAGLSVAGGFTSLASKYNLSSTATRLLKRLNLGGKESKISKDDYMTQGYTVVGDNALVAAYKKGENSRIYVFDKDTNKYKGLINLNNHSHVGGLAYDEKNDLLFVTGSKKSENMPEIYTYNFNNLVSGIDEAAKNIYKVTNEDIVKGTEKLTTGAITPKNSSSITFGNDALYAGTFDTKGTIIKLKYNYDKDSNKITSAKAKKEGYAGYGIQGMTYDKGTNSLITSTSNCILGTSKITNFNLDNKKITGSAYINKKGLQGINLSNGIITGVSEYGKNQGTVFDLNPIKFDTIDAMKKELIFKVAPAAHSFICLCSFNNKA